MIWTLYALIDTLIVSGVTTISADKLFVNFGFALVTTGLGMFLRMLVIQFEYSSADQSNDARNSVAQGLDQFQRELKLVLQELRSSRKAIHDTTSAWSEAMTGTASDVKASFGAAVQAVSSEIAAASGAVSSTNQMLQAVSRSAASFARRVIAAGDKLGGAASEAADRASGSMNEAARSLTAAAGKLAALELPENTLSAQLERFAHDLLEPSQNAIATSKQVAEAAIIASQRLDAVSVSTAQRLEQVGSAVAEIAAAVEGLQGHSEGVASSLREMTESSGAQIQSSRELNSVQRALAEASVALQSKIEELARETARGAEGMRGPAAELGQWSSEVALAATRAGQALASSAEMAAGELGRASNSIVDLGVVVQDLKTRSEGAVGVLAGLESRAQTWTKSIDGLVGKEAELVRSLNDLQEQLSAVTEAVAALRAASADDGWWRRIWRG